MNMLKNIAPFLGITLLIVSCASSGSSYKKDDTKSFNTGLIKTNFNLSDDQLSRGADLKYRVKIQYNDEDCMAKETEFSFYIESGPNTIYLSSRDLMLMVDGNRYHWEGPRSWNDIRNAQPVMGNIINVSLKSDTLQQIANKQKVSGVLAGQSFDWSYKNRAPIRRLLIKIDSAKTK